MRSKRNSFLNNEQNELIKNMSTTQTFKALIFITVTAVKLQMFGAETCHGTWKYTTLVTEQEYKNNLRRTCMNFK